jgi:hypothetical protein
VASKPEVVECKSGLPPELEPAVSVSMVLPSGRSVNVLRATAQFASWSRPITIHTWGNKPVLDVNGEQAFAEVAILRTFQRAGWSARWLEAYSANKGWPIVLDRWHPDGITSCEPVDLGSPEIEKLLRSIIQANGGSCRGCWDVLAWKGDRVILAESKRRSRDRINDNQRGFLEAALSVGIPADAFLIVEWTAVGAAAATHLDGPRNSGRAPSLANPRDPLHKHMSNDRNNAMGDTKATPPDVQIFATFAEWRAWYLAHPNGYFFNKNGNKIHRVGCPHYRLNDDVEDYFKRPKPCHVSRAVLSIWLMETRGKPAGRCDTAHCQ